MYAKVWNLLSLLLFLSSSKYRKGGRLSFSPYSVDPSLKCVARSDWLIVSLKGNEYNPEEDKLIVLRYTFMKERKALSKYDTVPSFTAWCTEPPDARYRVKTRKTIQISKRDKSVKMGAIEDAIEYLNFLEEDKQMNSTLTAKMFGVNCSTLSRRYRGVTGSKEEQYNNQRLLNNQQSQKLVQWIDMLCEHGIPPTPSMIANFAHKITSRKPGKSWVSRWLEASKCVDFSLFYGH
ncbi:hypothetical protein TSTA_049040 [Talaromyces stipitatus ATCC 10500]|uniref:HTH CENPB-type domain-containing protein n=1 Tax=Talaromyces stipitatus (strain ATCC 10500 / CBS 375.48 / QM 6759 / NRRL 1006) TaxID=441959 RepID=B8ML48_TALSN|nr:uncharacterized protein TSTA_049040 [Talaromyces stipitatus ATCC 10500]EED15464.1 hypothetical protein TSTA_049040 [Talaromyces stipitatus ATCC 10500]